MKTILTYIKILSALTISAQPGDFSYRICVYDKFYHYQAVNDGMRNPFTVYACEPSVSFKDDVQIPKWRVNTNQLQIVDTLNAVESDHELFPITTFFQGKSILDTKVLMIVRQDKDTMFIENCGENLISDQYGTSGLPPVLLFKKGIYDLSILQQERTYRIAQNFFYRDYWLLNSLSIKPQYNPWTTRMDEFKLLKKHYHKGDTLQLKITGHLISDGSCSNAGIVWILQKKNGDRWENSQEFLEQMDCGLGVISFDNQVVAIALLDPELTSKALLTQKIRIDSGTYRVVAFDDNWLPYFTEEIDY